MSQEAMITQGYAKSMVKVKNYEPRDERKARPQSRLTKDSQNSRPPHLVQLPFHGNLQDYIYSTYDIHDSPHNL
jgi:hypothetical protein